MGVVLYPKLIDTINKSGFEVRVPSDYEPVIPAYYRKHPELKPVYSESNANELSFMPISILLDMCINDVGFTIVHREDVTLIRDLLSQYITELSEVVGSGERALPPTDLRAIALRNSKVMLSMVDGAANMAEHEFDVDNNIVQDEGPTTMLEALQTLSNVTDWLR